MVEIHRLTMLPPAPHLCQECATEHEPGEAHNRDSLYYAFKFNEAYGRSPTWSDAIARCSPESKRLWAQHLLSAVNSGRLDRARLGGLIEDLIDDL